MSATHLPFSNRCVFAKVMQDNPEPCKGPVERILDIGISHISQVQVESEATSILHRSVRFGVFLESDEAAFEAEMQTCAQRDLLIRMRHYRSQLDRRLLEKGPTSRTSSPCTSSSPARGIPLGRGFLCARSGARVSRPQASAPRTER